MSTFWEEYKKRVAEGASKLSPLPKDVPQNILWLKAYVSERMETEGKAKYVGKSEDGTFGFTEELVNYLMYYAFEAGERSREHQYTRATSDMKAALDKVKDALDDCGWIDYPEY